MSPLPIALFDAELSCVTGPADAVSRHTANEVFSFFQQCPLFRWQDAQNDCEDRAEAICRLLQSWGLPAFKGWVFSGNYLKQTTGSLVNFWNYHVAAALPVEENGVHTVYIIDPSTRPASAEPLAAWAHHVTHEPCSWYLLRPGDEYIFHHYRITADNWHRRNRRNYKWTVQGLAGINGVSARGKAQLVFRKKAIAQTKKKFEALLGRRPF